MSGSRTQRVADLTLQGALSLAGHHPGISAPEPNGLFELQFDMQRSPALRPIFKKYLDTPANLQIIAQLIPFFISWPNPDVQNMTAEVPKGSEFPPCEGKSGGFWRWVQQSERKIVSWRWCSPERSACMEGSIDLLLSATSSLPSIGSTRSRGGQLTRASTDIAGSREDVAAFQD